MHTVTSICLQLKEHKQKATLEAVSNVLEINANMVLSGKPKNHLYSWIVDRGGKPISGSDPDLEKSDKPVITDYKELEDWLDRPENQSGASEEFLFLIENMVN